MKFNVKMKTPLLSELKFKNVKKYTEHKYPEFFQYINENFPNDISFSEKLYWYYHNINTYPLCPVCRKNKLKFKTLFYGYNGNCSQKCKSKNINYNLKYKQTNLERYGVENPFSSDEIKNKIKQTNLDRYGGSPMKSDEIKNKIKQTNLERYGCVCSLHNEEIQSKTKQTNLERYGVENPFSSEEIKNKIKQTNLERYGGSPMKSDEVKNKALNSYKLNFLKRHPEIIRVKYGRGQIDTIYTCKCNDTNCNKCFEKTFEIDSLHYWVRINNTQTICTKIFPVQKDNSKETSIEMMIRHLLDTNNISYISNDRQILNGKELDIYIPEKNIAIECNGVYWHSDLYKEKNYHFEKYLLCKNKGIKLITIWEDQYLHNKNIIESIILSKLGIYKKRIFARQCIIKNISSKDAKDFLNENHIQGYTSSSFKIGLYYNNELVSVMTFSRRKSGFGKYLSNNDNWELSRFCNKLNTQVIGGASKLFYFFIKNVNFDNIISYASHDISSGDIYNILGFNLTSTSKTSYWYIDKKTMIRYHRLNFSKKQLLKRGYNKELTEFEIMNGLEYFRIYDTGQSKYEYKKKYITLK